MSPLFQVLLAIVIVGALFFAARHVDKMWRVKHPDEKPFVWGYFQALLFFPLGLIWLVWPFLSEQVSILRWFYFVIYGVVGSWAGYCLISAKKRWAWLFVVLSTPNLLNWIINYFYGRNRWREFR